MNQKSNYTGVYYHRYSSAGALKWCAWIKYNGRRVHIGFGKTDREAAILRDKYIIKNGINRELQVLKKKPILA